MWSRKKPEADGMFRLLGDWFIAETYNEGKEERFYIYFKLNYRYMGDF